MRALSDVTDSIGFDLRVRANNEFLTIGTRLGEFRLASIRNQKGMSEPPPIEGVVRGDNEWVLSESNCSGLNLFNYLRGLWWY